MSHLKGFPEISFPSAFVVFWFCFVSFWNQLLFSCQVVSNSLWPHSAPGLPVPHHLSEFAQVHVDWISDTVQSFYPVSLVCSCLQSFPASGSFHWVGCSELLVIAFRSSFWAGELIFWCHIFLPFYTVYGVLMARILEWFTVASSSGPRFIRILHCDHLSRVALHCMTHSFTELFKPLHHDKAV